MNPFLKRAVLLTAILGASWGPSARAAFYGMPRLPDANAKHIDFSAPALPPFGHSKFCLRYNRECQARRAPTAAEQIELKPWRWIGLLIVNYTVNRAIAPSFNAGGLFTEEWVLAPKAGDCNDYAVTKRHLLIARGWPPSSLLLAEVVTPWGEHHLVLVVRTSMSDYVLDNLDARVLSWSRTAYQWKRIQSPVNPRLWGVVGAIRRLGPRSRQQTSL